MTPRRGAGTVPQYQWLSCAGTVSPLPVVSCMFENHCRDGEEEEILSSGQASPICKTIFVSSYRITVDDDT